MNDRLPGNLHEIFPLRFRLREGLRFFRHGDSIVAENPARGKRYSLRPWQYEMILRFDGKTTYEESARYVYAARPGVFTATGLLNFYNWLYEENLVLCECESIFELVLEEPPADPGEENKAARPRLSEFAERLLRDSRVQRAIAVSAVVVFFLSVLRIAWVAAPVFEPPVNRLYAEAAERFRERRETATLAESQRSAKSPTVEAVELSSRAVEPAEPAVVEKPAVEEAGIPDAQPEPASRAEAPALPPVPGPQVPAPAPTSERIETLRRELEACRIRRDEFYLQNDEEGYRREVHRMTNLAREIGDIEKGG